MDKDRQVVCDIVSEMLDHPDEHGIYPTTTAYYKLVNYIEQERIQALGWAIAECCTTLDKGDDPRFHDLSEILSRAIQDLSVNDGN